MTKRSFFRRCAERIAEELTRQSYQHWSSADYPLAFERIIEGRALQVEVVLLELTADYAHLSVSVDDGGWWAYFSPSTSVLIRNEQPRIDPLR